MTGRLDSGRRRDLLHRLSTERFDVLVIGGGVTGAGAALDAAARGLRVALVEARDLASGTSSRSSKLVHGGLRYLERLDLKLVREALKERDLLVSRIAPHLVKPISFLYPSRRRMFERPYVGAGLVLYNALEGLRRPVPYHRHLSATRARSLAPALKRDGLVGGMLYYDAQVDDARHTLTVARTARAHGALIATRVSALELRREDGAFGRVSGVRVRDEESGAEFEVAARAVVPYGAIDADTGMILRTERSVLFIIPWGRHWIVGTTDTDTDFDGDDRAEPTATEADVDYLLAQANTALERPLTRTDVVGVYAGLRPLVAADDASPTTRLSREHVVDVPVPGLATIAGGKPTTYRLMARDEVDAVLADYDRWVPASVTDRLPLAGAEGLAGVQAEARRLAEDHGLTVPVVEHLIERYGTLALELFDLIDSDPGLGRPLLDGHPYLRAEAVYAVTHEGALHVEDVLARRTRLYMESSSRGAAAAREVAGLMAGPLGWDTAQAEDEAARYIAAVEAEAAALRALDEDAVAPGPLGAA
ncbi:MAG: FAD-dependent oxidoreductase [Streptosporangiales bacterium]|nr:FAD-dependent oxidoreductase [Streptosporangiales bacterium]